VDDIILSTLPVADTIIGDTIVCTNDLGIPYNIPFNTGSTYLWSVQSGGGVIVAGQGTDNILIDWGGIPGTYKLDVSETTCSGTVMHIGFMVTVTACGTSPIASFLTGDQELCVGQCINFMDNSTNCSPCSWAWNFPGSVTGSSIDQNPANICYNTPGIYDVDLIITNTSNSLSDDTVSLGLIKVYPEVSFDVESDTAMCNGDSVNIHINNLIGGLPVDSFTMTFGSQFTHIMPSSVTGAAYYLVVSGTYWGATNELRDGAFKFQNNGAPMNPPAASSMWKIDGNGPGKPCPTDYNPNHLYYFYFTGTGAGMSFTFDDSNYSDNGGSLDFKIYHLADNVGIYWSTGENAPCITVSPTQPTYYSVMARNNSGNCSFTDSVLVDVIPAISIDAGADTVVCGISASPLTGSSTSTGVETFLWMSLGDGIFSNDTILTPIYTPGINDSANGSVNLVLMGMDSAGLCLPVFDTMLLTLIKLHNIDSIITVNASGCGMADGSATVFVSSGSPPYTYLWNDGQTTSAAINLADGSYSVTVTGATGCIVTSNTVTISAPGTIPPPVAGSNTTYCDGDALGDLFAATGSGGTITWYSDSLLTSIICTGTTLTPTNSIGTTYYYATETAGGCESPADTVIVTINALPSAPTVVADATYCQGDPMTDLIATAGSGGSITWYSDTALSVIIGAGSSLSPGSTLGTTVYYATETVGGCESIADSAVITITTPPAMPTASTSATYCEGETMTDLTATNSGGGTITWYSDASLSVILGTGPTFTPMDSLGTTIYYATETIGSCESTSDTVTITIYQQAPVPTMGANTTLCPYDAITGITATPYWDGIITWYSDAGLTTIIDTGETLVPNLSQGDNIFYATETALCCCPSEPGMVTVTLDDCDTIPDNVYMPNVFYVSGSNPDNNRLHVFGNGIAELNLIIYDRWGEKVYETSDVSFATRDDGLCCSYGTGWDGTYMNAGKALNTAVFAYILSGKLESGEEFFEKGNITLIK
jgi:roadblock/LC7 domain-containing protein